MALTPNNLDKVMSELVAVSRSAMSKREEAANLARIWGRVEGVSTAARVRPVPADPPALAPAPDRVRRRARWRRVA